MADYKIPDELKPRLAEVASKHNLGTPEALADELIAAELKVCEVPEGSLQSQIAYLVNQQGYSSADEAVEHLLLRGLHPYEEEGSTKQEAEAHVAHVKGLGHID